MKAFGWMSWLINYQLKFIRMFNKIFDMIKGNYLELSDFAFEILAKNSSHFVWHSILELSESFNFVFKNSTCDSFPLSMSQMFSWFWWFQRFELSGKAIYKNKWFIIFLHLYSFIHTQELELLGDAPTLADVLTAWALTVLCIFDSNPHYNILERRKPVWKLMQSLRKSHSDMYTRIKQEKIFPGGVLGMSTLPCLAF